MTNFKVSIVTVTFNAENSIIQTLNSIISQDYINKEIIVIDGCSKDKTIEFIQNFSEIDYFISEKDRGIYDAMNKGLKVANGDFLIFMNAGDAFTEATIISNFFKEIKHPSNLYYGNAIYFNRESGKERFRGGKFNKYRLAKTNLCHQTIFYPKAYYKFNSFNLKYRLLSDWEYNMKAMKIKVPYFYINKTLSYYDDTGLSIIEQDLIFKKDHKKLVLKNLGLLPLFYLGYLKARSLFRKYLLWK